MLTDRQPGNVVNGWWIIDAWVEIVNFRKRRWFSVVCPGCGNVSEKRADWLTRFTRCTNCYNEERKDAPN